MRKHTFRKFDDPVTGEGLIERKGGSSPPAPAGSTPPAQMVDRAHKEFTNWAKECGISEDSEGFGLAYLAFKHGFLVGACAGKN
jgi:hypothetical protein